MARNRILIVLLVTACAIILLIGLVETSQRRNGAGQVVDGARSFVQKSTTNPLETAAPRGARPATIETPQEIVANKLSQFGRLRRDTTTAFAAKYGIDVDPQITEFYQAIESGDWDAIARTEESLFKR